MDIIYPFAVLAGMATGVIWAIQPIQNIFRVCFGVCLGSAIYIMLFPDIYYPYLIWAIASGITSTVMILLDIGYHRYQRPANSGISAPNITPE